VVSARSCLVGWPYSAVDDFGMSMVHVVVIKLLVVDLLCKLRHDQSKVLTFVVFDILGIRQN